MLNNSVIVLTPRVRKLASIILYLIFGAQFIALLAELRDMSHLYTISTFVKALPFVYPVPFVLGMAFRRQIKLSVANQNIKREAADMCDDWITATLTVVYVVIGSFGQLHARF
jgi:hypothetical protein